MESEDYIKIRKSDFGLVQRKYKLSQEEVSMFGINMVKQNIAIEIGQFLLSQGLLNFKQERDILTAELYVVRVQKGDDK